jgi:hypothetical protein
LRTCIPICDCTVGEDERPLLVEEVSLSVFVTDRAELVGCAELVDRVDCVELVTCAEAEIEATLHPRSSLPGL